MNEESIQTYRQSPIIEPVVGGPDPAPQIPTLKEVLAEWVECISFWKDATRLLPAAYALFHFAGCLVFLYYLWRHASLVGCVVMVLLARFIGTIYNTVWCHRHCSRRVFKLSNLGVARLFLWTNPVCFCEESYVLPHRVHHTKFDEPGDSGWQFEVTTGKSAGSLRRGSFRDGRGFLHPGMHLERSLLMSAIAGSGLVGAKR